MVRAAVAPQDRTPHCRGTGRGAAGVIGQRAQVQLGRRHLREPRAAPIGGEVGSPRGRVPELLQLLPLGLSAMMEFLKVAVPKLAMPPPLPAEFPESVLLVMVIVLAFQMPPPLPDAEVPQSVLLRMVRSP